MRMIKASVMMASMLCLAETGAAPLLAPVVAEAAEPNVAVAPQYASTHVYVAPEDLDRFVSSFIATFGGTTSNRVVATVTPTPSSTIGQMVLTPVGILSMFGLVGPHSVSHGASAIVQFPGGYLVEIHALDFN